MKTLLSSLFLFFTINVILCQNTKKDVFVAGPYDTITVQVIYYNDEKMIYGELPPAEIYAELSEEERKRRKEWYKLKRTVFLTYPYMKAISAIINDINSATLSIPDKKEREKYLKEKERELKEKFTDRLLSMTTYQGKILIKLVHRETGKTCYDIIKMYKGATVAVTWQALALLFGNSLTKKYDPNGEDMETESLVREAKKVYGF